MTNTTRVMTGNLSDLLTLRGALNALSEHVYDTTLSRYVLAVLSVTDERFIISLATRVEQVPARTLDALGIVIDAHEMTLGGYEVYDRETGAVTFVEHMSDGSHVAQLEQLTKTRGAKARRWRRRNGDA